MPRKTEPKADVINMRIAKGCERYQRSLHLHRLIAIPECLIEAAEEQQSFAIADKLNCALRRERNRGRSGHWAYDLNRHIGLMQAYKYELEQLKAKPCRAQAVSK